MKVRPAIVYTILRLLVFLVPFGLMMLLPIFQEFYWLAAVFAALIGVSLSVIFLRRPLSAATADLPARSESRRRRRSVAAADAETEDAIGDATDPTADEAASGTDSAELPADAGPTDAAEPTDAEAAGPPTGPKP